MSKHNKIGVKGEQIAANFLIKKGYTVLFRNWRAGKKEIDLICELNHLIVVVEIKTRSATNLSYPEEAVTPKKRQFLKSAADEFMNSHPEFKDHRFDIVSVLMTGDSVMEIVHFEEAFN
jgi:putative endonuclease